MLDCWCIWVPCAFHMIHMNKHVYRPCSSMSKRYFRGVIMSYHVFSNRNAASKFRSRVNDPHPPGIFTFHGTRVNDLSSAHFMAATCTKVSRCGVVKPQLIFHCDGFQHLRPSSSMSIHCASRQKLVRWYEHVWTDWSWMSPCWQEILFLSAFILHTLRKPAKSCNSQCDITSSDLRHEAFHQNLSWPNNVSV